MNSNMRYCDMCCCEQETIIKDRQISFTFRNELFNIFEQYAECTACKNPVVDEELGNNTLTKIRDLYEKRHGVSPTTLKETRQSYNITQALFAKLLNMGIATVKRYELGTSSPDSTQLGIYKMLKENPKSIKQFYERAKDKFTEEEDKLLKEKLATYLSSDDVTEISYKVLEKTYEPYENSINNGFAPFQAHKLFNMVLFFSSRGVLITKLMKLLFYSDFLYFKRHQTVISGTPYCHLQFGPVPKNHDLILGCLQSMQWITVNEEESSEGYIRKNISAIRRFLPDIFTENELLVFKDVQAYFEKYGSREIADFSHKELGWIQTKDSQIIPYSYAKPLQLS